jgi:endoglucanase
MCSPPRAGACASRGQSTVTFSVAIIDRGINSTPVHALAYLYGSYPDSLGANHNSLITVLHDDALQLRVTANPLATSAAATGNVIAGTKFYVDPKSPAANAERHYARSHPAWAKALSDIAVQPAAHRFYMWNMGANVSGQVSHYLEGTQVQQPGSTVMLSTYSLVHGTCGYTATPAIQARYDDFIKQVAAGIGNTHVVFFLELDSLITAPCLSHQQLAIRDAELNYAISVLEADPQVKDGNEVLCNPPGRGLGPISVANRVAQPTGYAADDGSLWFSNPGGSGGQCVPGAPPTGVYWPAYAVMLADNWVHKIAGPHYPLTRAPK